MKLFVLSLALSMTAVAVSAQSVLPTSPATAPPSATAGIAANIATSCSPRAKSSNRACKTANPGGSAASIN